SHFLSLLLADLADAYRLADRLDDAQRTGQEAVELARELGARGHEVMARRALGAVLGHRDPTDVAGGEPPFARALALAENLSMRPTAARYRLGVGILYRRTGQVARARAELAFAAEAFRALSMASWLTRAEAELGEIGVTAVA